MKVTGSYEQASYAIQDAAVTSKRDCSSCWSGALAGKGDRSAIDPKLIIGFSFI